MIINKYKEATPKKQTWSRNQEARHFYDNKKQIQDIKPVQNTSVQTSNHPNNPSRHPHNLID